MPPRRGNEPSPSPSVRSQKTGKGGLPSRIWSRLFFSLLFYSDSLRTRYTSEEKGCTPPLFLFASKEELDGMQAKSRPVLPDKRGRQGGCRVFVCILWNWQDLRFSSPYSAFQRLPCFEGWTGKARSAFDFTLPWDAWLMARKAGRFFSSPRQTKALRHGGSTEPTERP